MGRKKTTTKAKSSLNEKQKKFCELYATDKDFFCNGIQSYAEAYGINLSKKGGYNTAKANAYRLLTNADILDRINELLELRGLNDSFVDKQLEKLITQDADFKSKLGAIKEYNLLKKRVSNKIIDIPDDSTFSIEIEVVKNNESKVEANRETSGGVE